MTMKAMTFQADITSIPIDDFTVHCLIVFDLTSIENAA